MLIFWILDRSVSDLNKYNALSREHTMTCWIIAFQGYLWQVLFILAWGRVWGYGTCMEAWKKMRRSFSLCISGQNIHARVCVANSQIARCTTNLRRCGYRASRGPASHIFHNSSNRCSCLEWRNCKQFWICLPPSLEVPGYQLGVSNMSHGRLSP